MLVGEASSEIVRVSASFGGSFWVTALAHYTRLLYLSKQSFELCSLKLLKKIYSINFKDDNERDRIIVSLFVCTMDLNVPIWIRNINFKMFVFLLNVTFYCRCYFTLYFFIFELNRIKRFIIFPTKLSITRQFWQILKFFRKMRLMDTYLYFRV